MSREFPWSDIAEGADDALMRRADPEHPDSFFWGRDHNGRPALCLELDETDLQLRGTKGSAEIAISIEERGRARLVWISLTSEGHEDVFSKLCVDLITTTRHEPDRQKRLRRVIHRLEEWMDLLGRSPRRGLSERQIRGLFAELGILCLIAKQGAGWRKALECWTGPTRTDRDFCTASTELEIKSYGERDAGNIRVSSETQLWPEQVTIYLIAIAITEAADGQSLGERIDEIQLECVSESPEVRALLEDRLEAARYVPHDRYYATRYAETQMNSYHVTRDFPAITPPLLASGVEKVRYSLKLNALAEFGCPTPIAISEFVEANDGN